MDSVRRIAADNHSRKVELAELIRKVVVSEHQDSRSAGDKAE